MEIEQLKKEKEELELQLEICRIERDDLARKNQQSDAPQTVLETRAVQEQILEEDRTFASQLLAEIWRGRKKWFRAFSRHSSVGKGSGCINGRVGSIRTSILCRSRVVESSVVFEVGSKERTVTCSCNL